MNFKDSTNCSKGKKYVCIYEKKLFKNRMIVRLCPTKEVLGPT